MNRHYLILFLFIVVLAVSSINIKTNENMENNNKIEIVIARYNEKLEWLKEKPFNNYPIICYNSGNDSNFYQPKNMKIVNI
jgi:hypothetical protein